MNAPFNPTPRREAMRIAGRLVTTDDVIAGAGDRHPSTFLGSSGVSL